jgi:hypothetical protein
LLTKAHQGQVLRQVGDAVIDQLLIGKADPEDETGLKRTWNRGREDGNGPELRPIYGCSARSRTRV